MILTNEDPDLYVEEGAFFRIWSEKSHRDHNGFDISRPSSPIRRSIPAGTVLLALEDHWNDSLRLALCPDVINVKISLWSRRGKVLTPYGVGWVLYNANNVTILGEEMGIPRKRSRKFERNGKSYIYIVKETKVPDHPDQKQISLTVQIDTDKPGRCMQSIFNHGVEINPSLVGMVIDEAIQVGWNPAERGSAFVHKFLGESATE